MSRGRSRPPTRRAEVGVLVGSREGAFALLSLGEALEYGAAHGALAMTTPGDTSMATLAEVEALVAGGTARVQR